MALIQASEHIFYMPGEKRTDRPYLYYLHGRRFSAAIDAGNSRAHVARFYEELENAGLPLPACTLITHWHWDHTFGIPYVNGPVIASMLTCTKLTEVSHWQWTEAAMRKREQDGEDIAFCNDCILLEYPDLSAIRVQAPDIGLKGEAVLNLGDLHIQLYPVDSIHSRDALLMYIPEEKALFAGDADCEDFYHGNAVDPDRLKAYVRFIGGLDFDRYFIGHDVPEVRDEVLARLQSLQEHPAL